MNAAAADTRTPLTERLDFVRYVAQHPRISPREVFRRLKFMGGFLGLGAIGVAVTLILIGLQIPVSEPARLLTAFGFAAAAVVCVATISSACLLLWGAFISQYVANLDANSALAEAVEEKEKTVSPEEMIANAEVAVQANGEIVDVFLAALEQATVNPQPEVARDVRKELAAIQEALKQIQQTMSPADQLRMYTRLQYQTRLGSHARGQRKLTDEEVQRLFEQHDLAAGGNH